MDGKPLILVLARRKLHRLPELVTGTERSLRLLVELMAERALTPERKKREKEEYE